jgi:hypothetical protein
MHALSLEDQNGWLTNKIPLTFFFKKKKKRDTYKVTPKHDMR